MQKPPKPRAAVIGAGMAGLTCAAGLKRNGIDVTVFDKGRAAGGRLATRRVEGAVFDHGAQYVTAKGLPFADFLKAEQEAGRAAVWEPRLTAPASKDRRDWLAGRGGMRRLVESTASQLTVHREMEIAALQAASGGWSLVTKAGATQGPFAAVIVTAPAPQTAALLAPHFADVARIRDTVMAPCWAVMLRFERQTPGVPDVFRNAGPIAWAARQSSKPGSGLDAGETWVVHASPAWSRDHLEDTADRVLDALQPAFTALDACFRSATPTYVAAHRWRYALVENAVGLPYLAAEERGLFAAGDWCLGPRVEAAFESGRLAGDAVVASLSRLDRAA
jgi:predicted NAD/FAD-dependent oxidoreductase